MKCKVTKGQSLYIGLFVILLLAGVTYFNPVFPAGIFLTAVVSLVGAYITLDVANNGVKGKFFNSDLYNAENKGDHNETRHEQ